ncbi:hypothetical protein CF65_01348 [Aggregatibacter actinomycetemcomitans HK1651]|nr:hypothetical protein CF65_01348 [Aggregatibacter actinomycetemcomitans HK1651]
MQSPFNNIMRNKNKLSFGCSFSAYFVFCPVKTLSFLTALLRR